jgi:hypothetical protein
MSKFKKFSINPQIQIALATGTSIIVLAYFSKRVLPEPLSYLELALPPFIAVFFVNPPSKKKKAVWYGHPLYGVLAILLATVLVIGLNA